DLTLELRALRELGAQPLVYSLPLPGTYDNYTTISKIARQGYYDLYRQATATGGVVPLDLSGHDEDRYFLHDIGAHLSPRGWVFIDRALDTFWQSGSITDTAMALNLLAQDVPSSGSPSLRDYCGSGSTADGSTRTPSSQDLAEALALVPPEAHDSALVLGADAVFTEISTVANQEPGGSIPVTIKGVVGVAQEDHYM